MSLDDGQSVTEGASAAPEREPSIGERLRSAREAQPLSLAQISAELRIEQKFLRALEDDRLDDFPAAVFAKGYLKQYGGLLGLDEPDLLAQYYRQVEVRDVPVLQHKPIRLRDEDQIRHWLAAAVVLALLAGGAVAWWFTQPSDEPTLVENTSESLIASPTPASAASLEQPPEQPGEPGQPGLPEAEQAVVVTAPEDKSPDVEQASEAAGTEIGPGPAGTVIELSFLEDCWTEISDARGERLFYGLGSAGARSRFSAMLPISIFFGNADGVEMSVDGSPYPIPDGSRQGNLARFAITEPGP